MGQNGDIIIYFLGPYVYEILEQTSEQSHLLGCV